MIDAAYHGQGIGRRLLQTRLDWIERHLTITRVRVATTAPVCGFFERMGFAVIDMTVGGFGPDVARYDLERTLLAREVPS